MACPHISIWSNGEYPKVAVSWPGSMGGCFVYSCKVPAGVERLKKIRVRSKRWQGFLFLYTDPPGVGGWSPTIVLLAGLSVTYPH